MSTTNLLNKSNQELEALEVVQKKTCCQKIIPGPPQVKFIIINELCERYSYYGMRAILVKFLQHELGFSADDSSSYTLYFGAVCYFTPLLGGYIADSNWGKYKTIYRFSLVYCTGGVLMALSAHFTSSVLTLIGLLLIGFGTGGIKPCVSTFGADQFPPGADRDLQMEKYFMAFYFSINVGSIGSFIATPLIREHFGYFWAFLVPAIFLFVAFLVFILASSRYVKLPPDGSVLVTICGVLRAACKGKHPEPGHEDDDMYRGDSEANLKDKAIGLIDKDDTQVALHDDNPEPRKRRFLDKAIGKYERSVVLDVRAVAELAPIFLCFPVFWALFDQQANTWEQMAEAMDLGFFTADQMAFWNPLLVMFFIPLFDHFVYPCWNRCQPGVTALHKMGVGMIFAMASFIVSAFLQMAVDANPGKISIFLQLPQYILITFAEILISITGLEFAYTQAPLSMKAFISSVNLAMVAIGDLSAGIIYQSVSKVLSRPNAFFLFAGLMAVNFIVFVCVARRYKFKNFKTVRERTATLQMEDSSKHRLAQAEVDPGGFKPLSFAGEDDPAGQAPLPCRPPHPPRHSKAHVDLGAHKPDEAQEEEGPGEEESQALLGKKEV